MSTEPSIFSKILKCLKEKEEKNKEKTLKMCFFRNKMYKKCAIVRFIQKYKYVKDANYWFRDSVFF